MGVDTVRALAATDRVGGPRVNDARIVDELAPVALGMAIVGRVQARSIDNPGL